jgi:hypothetical protein
MSCRGAKVTCPARGPRDQKKGGRRVVAESTRSRFLPNHWLGRVDLVFLSGANPFVAAEIIRGERLFASDSHEADEYELYVLRRAGDLAPLERERMAVVLGEPPGLPWRMNYLRASPLDLDACRDLLQQKEDQRISVLFRNNHQQHILPLFYLLNECIPLLSDGTDHQVFRIQDTC